MTADPRKAAIAAAFGKAAPRYEEHAAVQRVAAERLAERVARLPLPPRPRVLEIGCGTGFLSRALRERIGPADWLFTDLSPGMLARCRATLGDPANSEFRIVDGEQPDLDGPFNLIVSSLALQWFRNPAAALARWAELLAPGGRIAVATLAADSFLEWREAHHALGLEAGVPTYPTRHTLDRLWPAGGEGSVEEERLLRRHADGLEFLAELKGIGAHLPAEGRRPLPPGALRRVLRQLERPEGLTMTHHIAYGLFRKDGAQPRGVFVTGTDTGVGKTLVSACLARAWSAVYWKPLQTGLKDEGGDTPTVTSLAALPAERVHPPAYALAEPLSPHAAAELEGVAIDAGALTLPDTGRPLVVEGAGGLMVPVTEDVFIIDLIARFGLPVVLVARSTLGTINHTLLSLEALRARGLAVAGVVLNGPPNPGNRAAIERFGKVRVLAEIPTLDRIDAETVADAAALIPSFDSVFP
ncbi:dethiobiotin synthase (plasmid) [Azospirillum baldaniorum]|uniref:dethiobiotin synthase n=1 Tax=Azospirillum baldaniorum TaxID=1064539 RepID=UPI000D600C44|nr:dethiobiotin synthase [Azospirillum baldaniorum]AWJ94971.1 dethiobiotin synthase [Azospirillum baldaniorum]TWA75059.1 malonyl-CoA O-methyltransferase [Azospirillum brasilense]